MQDLFYEDQSVIEIRFALLLRRPKPWLHDASYTHMQDGQKDVVYCATSFADASKTKRTRLKQRLIPQAVNKHKGPNLMSGVIELPSTHWHGCLIHNHIPLFAAFAASFAAFAASLSSLGLLFPMFHPQLLNVLTTFGVTAAASGTRTNMKDLWIA